MFFRSVFYLLKKSLKAIITSIFVISMFSTGIVCSATETTTATTTTTSTSVSHNYKSHSKSSVSSSSETGTTTTSAEVTSETLDVTTTPSEGTTTAVTTTPETTSESTTTTMDTTTTTVVTSTDSQGSDLILYADKTYEEKLLSIQKIVDKYLYNTSFTPKESLVLVKKYIKAVAVLNDISSDDILYLYKYANNIVELQKESIKTNESFYTTLDNTISKITYKNYTAIEAYCKNVITNAFKNEVISSKETLTLLGSLHDRVMSNLTERDLELAQYNSYRFISNQIALNQYKATYTDMKGWIYIDGVGIDSPLMQPPVEDNEYYLQHSWDGYSSSRGTIELDYRCTLNGYDSPNETTNTLIYGHNLSDGTMFSNLLNYKDKSYWEEHQLIEISSSDEQRLYKIYAVCSVYGLSDGTQFKYWDAKYINMDEATFNEHIALTKQTMFYDTQCFPQFGDDIITLQTCDNYENWRVVIFAKRVK